MKQTTLLRHLLAWTLGALILVWGSFVALGYHTGQHEADELTDGHLASITALLLSLAPGALTPGASLPASLLTPELKAHDYQQSMSVAVWNRAGTLLTHMGAAPLPVYGPREGFETLSLGQPPQQWRVFSRWDEANQRKIMVLLSVRERDELAQDIASQIAEPGLWLLPVVALALGLAIRRGLRPLYQLSRDVHALDIQHGAALEARSRHEELRATVEAINTLMERYQAALVRERALANEFAHEMRTPLAAVSLHARALKGLADGQQRADILARLDSDVLRAGQVLTHLLALARASRAQWDEAAQTVNLAELARAVAADFAPAAHESGHELAVSAPSLFTLSGHPLLLELAVRNLVENALSHTPRGTHVDIQIDPLQRWLQVCDDGGSAATLSKSQPREMLPVRSAGLEVSPGLGLGLGHRVVEKIAAIHGARFEEVGRAGAGRCYRMVFASVDATKQEPAQVSDVIVEQSS